MEVLHIRLIVVDGLDGVGKDTQANLIAQYYEDLGVKVIIRSHPSIDNFFGRKAKESLFKEGKAGKIKASIFYMLDVLNSVRKYYNPKKKETLIMVRYLVGTAYLPKKLFKFGYAFFENFVPTSQYMFYLDAPIDVLLKRIKKRDELEIFETETALEKVGKKARILTKNWNVIDTSDSIDDTFGRIKKILKNIDKN